MDIKRLLFKSNNMSGWANAAFDLKLDVRKELTPTGTFYAAFNPDSSNKDEVCGIFGTNQEGGFICNPIRTIGTAKLMLKSFRVDINNT